MFDPQNLIATFGYLGMFLTVFIETGLLVGFFLPGDSLLLAAGIFAATPGAPIQIVPTILVFIAGSFLGDQLGYWVGRIAGPRVFNRPQSRFFDPENVTKAKAFFDKYGVLTIIVARFVPVVRAFAPTMAGVTKLNYAVFIGLSAVGAILWGSGVTLLGYFLGRLIPDLEKYIYLVVIGGILAAVVPSVLHLMRAGKKH
jgi:membrane-associated protein